MVLYVYLEMEWCDALLEIDKLSDSEIACTDSRLWGWFQCTVVADYTVWKVLSSNWRSQNVPLSITDPDMFVIDHKENVSLINHKIVCD